MSDAADTFRYIALEVGKQSCLRTERQADVPAAAAAPTGPSVPWTRNFHRRLADARSAGRDSQRSAVIVRLQPLT